MHTKELVATVLVVFNGLLVGNTIAQDIEITSFSDNGRLTWTTSMTNVSCSVEWASSLAPSTTWHRTWQDIDYMWTTSSLTSVSVPMFYRIVCSTNTLHIPQANIIVDGDSADWNGIPEATISPLGFDDEGDGPVGTDLKALYLARSNSTVFFMFEVWTNTLYYSNESQYMLWIDNNMNETVNDGDSCDRQVSAYYSTGEEKFKVAFQNMGDYWPNNIDANGQAVGNNGFLEGSFDAGALGVNRVFTLESGTHCGSSWTNYDRFPVIDRVVLERE